MAYDSDAVLGGAGVCCITGEITDKTTTQVVPWIVAQNLDDGSPRDHLTLLVCSNGGSLPASWSIIDAIKGSSIPVHTVGMGQIMSAGFLIYLAGKRRVLTPNCEVMAHQFWHGAIGKHHELVDATVRWDHEDQRMFEYYRKVTKLTPAQIRQKLMGPGEHYYTAAQVRRLGLADKVTTWRKA